MEQTGHRMDLSPITETSYLTAQNVRQYRAIMRLFFREYEKMRFQLYKEDVLELLRRQEEFADYTMAQLAQDLDALVGWKNLTPIQDPRKVYTIADYKNKQYRYTMSEYAVEIERLTARLENLFLESGNLSTNLFKRLADNLEEAELVDRQKGKEINEWWNNLQEDFKRLNQNYQDYLREFYSGRAEKLLKSVEFIVHKDRFIAYLKEFVQEMQFHASRIAGIIKRKESIIESSLLEKVVESEMEIPRTLSDGEGNRAEDIREQVYGKWESLKGWFLPKDGRECESGKVLAITNDIIRGIIQNAAFVEIIEKFNEAVETGVDPEFNRASFAGDFINPDGNPGIFEAPFYAGARTPAAHITKGGLKVNTSAEVIGTDGSAIPGLCAAGEVTGGRTVAGLLEAMTSGRTAGKTVMGK